MWVPRTWCPTYTPQTATTEDAKVRSLRAPVLSAEFHQITVAPSATDNAPARINIIIVDVVVIFSVTAVSL